MYGYQLFSITVYTLLFNAFIRRKLNKVLNCRVCIDSIKPIPIYAFLMFISPTPIILFYVAIDTVLIYLVSKK
jgi:hypothetical protein